VRIYPLVLPVFVKMIASNTFIPDFTCLRTVYSARVDLIRSLRSESARSVLVRSDELVISPWRRLIKRIIPIITIHEMVMATISSARVYPERRGIDPIFIK
jgi:hypothetical protein